MKIFRVLLSAVICLTSANASLADLKGHVEVTEGKLGMTTAELAKAKSRAESIRKDQIAADQKLSTQLTQFQTESNEKIGVVSTDLGGAKKDIETTRNDLETTKGKLDRANGDMGVMSGLIARNHDDLEDLKRRGERNYYEFRRWDRRVAVGAAGRAGADCAEQSGPKAIQIHDDRVCGRQIH